MRYFFRLIFVPLLFSSQFTFGQDSALQINKGWLLHKKELEHRADIISVLITRISDTKKIDKRPLNKTKAASANLTFYVDTLQHLDKQSVATIGEKNDSLTHYLARVLVLLEVNKGVINETDIRGLLSLLTEAENKIAITRRVYNDICRAYNRQDLIFFGRAVPEKAPSVKF